MTATARLQARGWGKFARCCGLSGLAFLAASGSRADQTVTIGPGNTFSPPSVAVAPGERVAWVWAASPHSSTSDSSTAAESWDSGILKTGAAFSHIFTVPGTYPYYCKVHSSPAPAGTMMNGVVQVIVPPATPTPTLTPPPASPTPTPPSSPTPAGPIAPGTAIPMLGRRALAALAIALAAGSLALIRRTMP